ELTRASQVLLAAVNSWADPIVSGQINGSFEAKRLAYSVKQLYIDFYSALEQYLLAPHVRDRKLTSENLSRLAAILELLHSTQWLEDQSKIPRRNMVLIDFVALTPQKSNGHTVKNGAPYNLTHEATYLAGAIRYRLGWWTYWRWRASGILRMKAYDRIIK